MGILCVIVMLGPGLFAAVLLERFNKQENFSVKTLGLSVIFCFLIHLLNLSVLFLRGSESINFGLQLGSMLYSVPFLVKYMGLSCVFALLLPHVLIMYHIVMDEILHKADGVIENEK